MKKFAKNNIVKFTVALFLIGVVTGLIFYFAYKPNLNLYLEEFKTNILSTHQNTFLESILAISLVFVLSISIVGIPVLIFYLFYEGLSVGFTLAVFLSTYSLKGLLFYSVFLLLAKIVFLISLIYFTVVSLMYVARFIDAMTSKNKEELNRAIISEFYRFLVILVITLVNSSLIYLFSNKILGLLIGLI